MYIRMRIQTSYGNRSPEAFTATGTSPDRLSGKINMASSWYQPRRTNTPGHPAVPAAVSRVTGAHERAAGQASPAGMVGAENYVACSDVAGLGVWSWCLTCGFLMASVGDPVWRPACACPVPSRSACTASKVIAGCLTCRST